MKKKYSIIVTEKTFVEVDVDNNIDEEKLLDKIEEQLDKGFEGYITYFEIEGEINANA